MDRHGRTAVATVLAVVSLTACTGGSHATRERPIDFDYPGDVTVADALGASDLVVVVSTSAVHASGAPEVGTIARWSGGRLIAFDITGSTPSGTPVAVVVNGLDSRRAKLDDADASTDLRRERPYVLSLRRVPDTSTTATVAVPTFAPVGGPAGVFFLRRATVITVATSYAGLDAAPRYVLALDSATGDSIKTSPPVVQVFDRTEFDRTISR